MALQELPLPVVHFGSSREEKRSVALALLLVFTQEDLPTVVAWLVQETAAEFKVLSMRAERGTWEPPHAVFATVLIRETFETYWGHRHRGGR